MLMGVSRPGLLMVIIAILGTLPVWACGGGTKEVEFSVRVENRQLVPSVVSVKKDAKVVIKIETDEAGRFRIRDYDVRANLEPGKVSVIRFTAFGGGQQAGDHDFTFLGPNDREEQNIGVLRVGIIK